MTVVTFQMDISVYDPRELYKAARNQAFEQLQSQPFDARRTMRYVHSVLRNSDGEADLASCVQWLADPGASDIPGTSILESRCD